MTEVLDRCEPSLTVLHTGPELRMDDEKLFRFCMRNKELRIERSAAGDLIIMSPEGGSSGHGSIELAYHFQDWARRDGTGRSFGSSTGFILPNKAMRSPDVSWVTNKRLARLTERQWNKFLPLCPDFALELRSPSDRLPMLKEKMEEYIENGARLAWLLDPIAKTVHVYRPGALPEVMKNPAVVSGDPILPGFSLDVRQIWAAMHRKPSR
jgi:Uma2 family endonuclease